jgi:hypothetical protein
MSLTLTFPTNVQLDLLTQEYQVNRAALIGISRVAPVANRDAHIVEWEQLDFDTGMTPPHVIGTDPKIEMMPGSVRRQYEPGAFKASEMVDEGKIIRARAVGTFGNLINLDDLVARRLAARQDKTFIREEWCVWKALGGALSINENDVVINETFPVQTFATVVPWSTHATATPFADIQALAQKFPGTGASAAGAVIYLNQKTMNDVLQNKNGDDIWGMRGTNFVSQTYSLKQVNDILSANNLPTLEVYDEGYPDVNKVYQRYITDGKPICVGKRPAGQVVANFLSTISLHRTVNGQPAPGPFSIIEVNGGPNNGALTVSMESLGQSSNPNLKLTGGIYGGPVIWYPRSVVAMDVTHTGA